MVTATITREINFVAGSGVNWYCRDAKVTDKLLSLKLSPLWNAYQEDLFSRGIKIKFLEDLSVIVSGIDLEAMRVPNWRPNEITPDEFIKAFNLVNSNGSTKISVVKDSNGFLNVYPVEIVKVNDKLREVLIHDNLSDENIAVLKFSLEEIEFYSKIINMIIDNHYRGICGKDKNNS